jgi:hypothetical protein
MLLDDILKLLDRWSEWKRMREAPTRLDEAEKRIAELEAKLGGKWPADVSKYCGERGARLYKQVNPSHEVWFCEKCKRSEQRYIK